MSNKFLEKIFSVKNRDNHKVINILGLKIKLKNKQKCFEDLQQQCALYKEWLLSLNGLHFENFLNSRLIPSNKSYQEFINNLFLKKKLLCTVPNEGFVPALYNYNIIFKNSNLKITSLPNDFISDEVILFGTQANDGGITAMYNATVFNSPILISEQAFLSTIFYQSSGISDVKKFQNYSSIIGFIFDNQGTFFDARKTNYLEQMLNDKNFVISEDQCYRARKCIDKIIENHLSKYNNQPIFEPEIGRANTKKVLVIDQTYKDASIRYGLASDMTFEHMLNDAIKENPNADIIVKTHPDTKTGAGGYYTGLKQHDNIYPMTDLINPISLLKYVDKVYVCTSQFGFEALMCGKEVHVYGIPFYANWGLTVDKQICPRRTNKRSLEEIFYITYIIYSHWVNPKTKSRCEIEEAIDYLIELRECFFKEFGSAK